MEIKLNSFKEANFFPTIVQSFLYDNVTELNKELLSFVKRLVEEKEDAATLQYITTEGGAQQPHANVLLDYYGKEDCITTLVDKIITPAQEQWVQTHFYELTGNPKPSGARFNVYSWATLYGPNSWQTPHMHRDKMFTGIYYVKMNDEVENDTLGAQCTSDVQKQPVGMKSEGSLVIQNPHPQSSQPTLGGWQTHREILPSEGELIIIPSWVSHYPKPFSTGERCVIVFDAQFIG